ncbi:unnamed protein product [Nyctereutes procyonoides]|uniref:(raccoon dog) hypothetical protein n=1 Tax=Nyctereutes procyonoides TaxID=34880 RepID=A0A811XVS7_NYCPR|nr:unnamed protein product [Nyctereutes procyonoides]
MAAPSSQQLSQNPCRAGPSSLGTLSQNVPHIPPLWLTLLRQRSCRPSRAPGRLGPCWEDCIHQRL